MKTSELSGVALDWAVAKCDESVCPTIMGKRVYHDTDYDYVLYSPSTNWAQGGPILEREKIEVKKGNPLYFPDGSEKGEGYEPLWIAGKMHGQTYLIAAMRCYVASKLGDEVEIPKELL